LFDLNIYDGEATDLDVRNGQLTQFASIRADDGFNVLEETEVRIRRLPYVVPSPEALRVTGTDPFDLDDARLPTEFESASVIERALRPRMTRTQYNVTYNGLRYDDEMLRTMFFRNLRNPWFSSGKNIRRIDLLSVVRLVHAGDPDAIRIPANGDGTLTWKLEAVCRANGIDIKAHDAMGDVRATLALARLTYERARWAWDEAVRCGSAAAVESLLAACLTEGRPAWLFTHFGKPDLVPSAVLAGDGTKRWLLADLREEEAISGLRRDVKEALAKDQPSDVAARISERLYSKDSPFRVIRSNASPLLVSDSEVQRLFAGANIDTFRRMSSGIKDDLTFMAETRRVLSLSKFDVPGSQTSEERIYDGFVPDFEKPRMGAFLNAKSWGERARVQFTDPRLRDFAARLVVEAAATGRAPDVPEDVLEAAAAACEAAYARPHAGANSRWMTLAGAREKGADERWEQWAAEAFGDAPSARADDLMTPQMGFGF